jgi:hypothetical protein
MKIENLDKMQDKVQQNAPNKNQINVDYKKPSP